MAQRLIAAALVGLSLVYLLAFVPRGWIPHDEGMTGQSAERVLAGGLPHVDYQEPYTGGLSALHAAVFRLAGIDLLFPRRLLFGGAALAQLFTYLILRRFVQPIGAAIGACLALGWSFPNYFASLPSWWVLVCALASLWAFVKHVETGLLRYAAAAGLAAGASILIKQTGLYVLVALVMALLYDSTSREGKTAGDWRGKVLCAAVAFVALGLAVAIVRPRLVPAELLYLLLPIATCSWVLLSTGPRAFGDLGETLVPPIAAVAAAAAPLLLFLAPYLVDGQLGTLVNGLFVLPQKRVQFASMAMPPAGWIVAGAPLLAMVVPLPKVDWTGRLASYTGLTLCLLGMIVLILSFYDAWAYQLIWQAARGFAALAPVAAGALLLSGQVHDVKARAILFGCTSMLAWASLVQFPFSAPIYFCYVTPLAVIAAAAVAGGSSALRRPAVGACALVLLLFAIGSMNRGYVYNLGLYHNPNALSVPLDLNRAHLVVSAADAATYRRVTELIATHIGGGHLIAGPDCPEVYYLSGQFSASGTLFEFFGDSGSMESPEWRSASVIVLNHQPSFSAKPIGDFAARVRTEFPNGAGAGRFEVRWR